MKRRGNWWWGAMGMALFVAPLGTFVSASAGAARLSRFPVPVAGVDAFGLGFGQLGLPGAVAVDSQGDVFVGDQAKSRVVEFAWDPVSSSYRKAGAVVAGIGGPGKGSTQLSLPDDSEITGRRGAGRPR